MMRKLALLVVVPVLGLGCFNDSGGSGADDSGSSSNGPSTGDDDGTEGGSAEQGDGDGDAEQGDGDGDGDGEGDGDGDGDGEGTKWDTLGVPDAPPCAGGDGGDPEFSYIWIANSTQGTMSKIDTQTLVEEGRYIVRPDGNGSPSRTSVSLSGHAAVANRNGGVTKVYARPEYCEESNGMPGIQTAVDANYLPWGTEECVAWFTPMNYASQRPVAWAQGIWNNQVCGYQDEQLWTAATQGSVIDVMLLDGDTGVVDEMVNLGNAVPGGYYGIYGAAVDGDGNFWGSQLGQGKLVNIDREDMTVQIWNMATSGYGMTVDHEGYVWTCSSEVARFDPQTETWQTAYSGGTGGCMADGEDTLWVSAWDTGLIAVDRETLQVTNTVGFGGTAIHGTSIDFYGYVWGVSYSTPYAYRVDPDTLQYDTFQGLTGPYTYSDMTGFALSSAGNPNG